MKKPFFFFGRVAGLGISFFLMLGFFLFPGSNAARATLLDIQKVKSPGGLTAWLVEDHSIPVIALEFSFRGSGAAQDPVDKQGLAKMASNTMDEGAGPLDSQAFQKELRDLAIDFHFNSDRDHFSGELRTLTKNKGRALELLKLALTKPRFDEEAVIRMREANQARIRSALSDPEWIAARLLNDKAFEGHPYARNSGGTISSLNTITSADLKLFAQGLARDQLVVSAAGDITAAELSTILDEIFGELREKSSVQAVPDTAIQNAGKIFTFEKDIPQTVIEVVQPGMSRADSDFHIAQVMNFILGSSGFGSRLTEEIREKRGLTYGIYSSYVNMDHADMLEVSGSTKIGNAREVLDLVKAEWKKIRNNPVSPEELADAKSYLRGSLPLSLTSTDKIAGLLQSLQLDRLPLDYLDRRDEAIQATTAADIQRVAQKTLNSESFMTILVGRPENIEDALMIEVIPDVE
ncbi:MAG: insulinase family protein [Alphaproteobacteria bacterium]|nr:insulinase family protein [Alphaproteobacteria bacterium]